MPDDSFDTDGSYSPSDSESDQSDDLATPAAVASDVDSAGSEKGEKRRHSYKRKKKYRSKAQKQRRVEALAVGTSIKNAKTTCCSQSNQWAQVMQRMNGDTRATRPSQKDKRLKVSSKLFKEPGGTAPCHLCAGVLMEKLEAACEPALLTQAESRTRHTEKRQGKAYHYSRLRLLLMNHAFDNFGNPCFHSSCIARHFHLSPHFMTGTHNAVHTLSGEPTKQLSKHTVVNRGIENRVVVPRDFLGSQSTYLKQLKDVDLVKVQALDDIPHGLFGKPSNNKRAQVEQLFIQWVQMHRSPTGRTPDSHGIYHGAEYHMQSISEQFVSNEANVLRSPSIPILRFCRKCFMPVYQHLSKL